MQLLNKVLCTTLVSIAILTTALGQKSSRPMKQPAEVVKAYRVCEQFQKILSQNLDFNAAFEQTFTANTKRQRAIAIKDGEFDDTDFAAVETRTLINAYKSRMQLVYLMLPLARPSDEEE